MTPPKNYPKSKSIFRFAITCSLLLCSLAAKAQSFPPLPEGGCADQLPPGGWDAITFHQGGVENGENVVPGWPVTSYLNDIYVTGGFIFTPHDKKDVWFTPRDTIQRPGGTGVNANIWAIYFYEGRWNASAWDFMRPGQFSKDASHMRPRGWAPRNGEVFYTFISGLARYGFTLTNVFERSNVVAYTWGQADSAVVCGGEVVIPEPEPEPVQMGPINDLILDDDESPPLPM